MVLLLVVTPYLFYHEEDITCSACFDDFAVGVQRDAKS